jgi:hypothetical protein
MSSIDTSDEDGYTVVLNKRNSKQRKNVANNVNEINPNAAYNNVGNMISNVQN